MLQFDVNEVFRIDPTTYANEPFVKKTPKSSDKPNGSSCSNTTSQQAIAPNT